MMNGKDIILLRSVKIVDWNLALEEMMVLMWKKSNIMIIRLTNLLVPGVVSVTSGIIADISRLW
jgi:hypothetical protein